MYVTFSFSRRYICRGVKLSTHLHLEPRLRMRVVIEYTSSPPIHFHGIHRGR